MSDYEKKVKIAMTEKGIATYTELAARIGITPSYVNDIVRNNRKATEMRQMINDYLGIEGE